MEKKLHLLDSFAAEGSDGKTYKVCGYEHMTRDEQLLVDGRDHWESTGKSEYKLSDGRSVDMRADGSMRIAGTDISLKATGRATV
jgi:hypothetical protein